MARQFGGVIPALLTPFKGGTVDTAALARLVDFLIESGVHGLYPCGTTGEGMVMSAAERKLVAETVVRVARDRIPVMVHVGAASTAETVELALHARSIGAAAIGVVAPYFYSVDKMGLVRHFQAVADAVPGLPVYLYNIPGNAKNDVTPDVAKQAADACHNIAGVKDSSKDLTRLEDYVQTLGPDYAVLVGSDALFLPALTVGGTGVISAVANVFPREVLAVYEACKAGDMAKARENQYRLNQLRNALKEGPYLAAYKAALRLRGMEFGGMKAPLREMPPEGVAKLKAALEKLNVNLLIEGAAR